MLAIGASAAIVEAGPWSFMSLVPANKMVASSVKLATTKLGVKSVAIIYDRTNSSSVLIKNAFETAVKERGVQIVVSEGISPQDSNFGPLATKLHYSYLALRISELTKREVELDTATAMAETGPAAPTS